MRSSKSRSRSKQNRPRSLGNIINRVFDSSGPEGKVRGTPQQIIEKYQLLARDAQLSNDRVAAENFLQHAEHYTRMLAEAQREMAAEQEARQQQYQQNGNGGGHQQGRDRDRDGRERNWRDDRMQDPGAGDQPDVPGVIGLSEDEGTALVETPEARGPDQPRQEYRRRDDRPRDDRPRDDRPRDDRPRDDRPREERARDDRPREERSREDRPREDRGREDRPREDKPRQERRDPRPPRAERAPRVDEPAAPVEQSVGAPAPEAPAVPGPDAEAAAKPRRPRAPKKTTPAPEGDGGPREAAE